MRRGRRLLATSGAAGAVALVAGLGPFATSSEVASLPFEHGEAAKAADGFVDSIGVATHLSYRDTSYNEFGMVKERLEELGVRHIRDGFPPDTPVVYDRFIKLAESGIRATFVMGAPDYGGEQSPYGSLEDLFDILRTDLLDAAEAVEGPNEPDLFSSGATWVEETRRYQERLYDMVKEDDATKHLPVLAPAIGRSNDRDRYNALGDLSDWVEYGNIHVYPGGVMMSDGMLSSVAEHAKLVSGDRPLQMTETGFHTSLAATDQPDGHPAVAPGAAGILTARLLLESYAVGIERTFIYQLSDGQDRPEAIQANFGLLYHDFTPKPAYTSIQNLIRLLADPGQDFDPGFLDYQIEGAGEDVQSLLFQKSDGRFVLALWRQVEVADGVVCGSAGDSSRTVTVRTEQEIASMRVYQPACSADALTSGPYSSSTEVPLSSDVMLVELTPNA